MRNSLLQNRLAQFAVAPEGPQLSSYDPPWYDRVVNGVTDLVYGDDANAQERAWIDKLVGPQNPLNVPAQFSQGVNQATDGYNQGNYGQMAGGIAQAGLAALPVAGATAARSGIRNALIARGKQGTYPDQVSAFGGAPRQSVGQASQPVPAPRNPSLVSANDELSSRVTLPSGAGPTYKQGHGNAVRQVIDGFGGSPHSIDDAYQAYAQSVASPEPRHVFDRMYLDARRARTPETVNPSVQNMDPNDASAVPGYSPAHRFTTDDDLMRQRVARMNFIGQNK